MNKARRHVARKRRRRAKKAAKMLAFIKRQIVLAFMPRPTNGVSSLTRLMLARGFADRFVVLYPRAPSMSFEVEIMAAQLATQFAEEPPKE